MKETEQNNKNESARRVPVEALVMPTDEFDWSNFDLEKVMDEVLPGVLFKDCDWMWWEDDLKFDENDEADLYQANGEPFSDFVKRILLHCWELEKEDDWPTVAIDYACACDSGKAV